MQKIVRFSVVLFVYLGFAIVANRVYPQQKTAKLTTGSILTDTVNLNYTVEDAPEWTSLFKRNSGWFGGDGIFSVPLNGIDKPGPAKTTKTLLIFSDSMIGEIEDGKLQPGYVMINNTVAVLSGEDPDREKLNFYWDKDKDDKPKAVFTPQTPGSKKGEYFWLGDGFVNHELNNTIYIFGYRMRNTGAAVFGFEEVGNTIIAIPAGSEPPYKKQRQLNTPMYLSGGNDKQNSGSFGAGVFVNTQKAGAPNADGYIYVYGVKGLKKEVIVARVLPENFEDFKKWRFWNGKYWDEDINKVAAITSRASNELSLTPLPDGRYALIFQTDGIGTSVGLRIGLSPVGPFGPVKKLWDCPEVNISKNFFVYNAKAHPHLSRKGELLISYNVNSFDFFDDLKKHPDLYRPRFIRIKFG